MPQYIPIEQMMLEVPPRVKNEMLTHIGDDYHYDFCMEYLRDRQMRIIDAAAGDTRRPNDSHDFAAYKLERYYGQYFGIYLSRVRKEVRIHRASRYAAYDAPAAAGAGASSSSSAAAMAAPSAVSLLLGPNWKLVADAIFADRLAMIHAHAAGRDIWAVATPMFDLLNAIARHEPVAFPAGVLVETIEFYAQRREMPRRAYELSIVDQVAADRDMFLALRLERDMQGLASCGLGPALLHPISTVLRDLVEANFTAWCWNDKDNCLNSILEHDESCQHNPR